MALFYLDASALVKRYVIEQGTSWVMTLTNPANNHVFYAARITGAEVASALVRKMPALAAADLARALADLQQDFFQQFQRLAITDTVVKRAMRLAEQYRLRGYDAVQLGAAADLLAASIARSLPPFTFVSADQQLNAAAMGEGLTVDDPNQHP